MPTRLPIFLTFPVTAIYESTGNAKIGVLFREQCHDICTSNAKTTSNALLMRHAQTFDGIYVDRVWPARLVLH